MITRLETLKNKLSTQRRFIGNDVIYVEGGWGGGGLVRCCAEIRVVSVTSLLAG